MSRRFPPVKGGMEKVCYELCTRLSKITNLKLVCWKKSQVYLPLVLPYFFLKSFWILLKQEIDLVHLGDALLSPLGLMLKILFELSVSVTAHGKDVIWKFQPYQFLIPACLKQLDKIICVSSATRQECIQRGVPTEKAIVIPNGISDDFYIKKDKGKLRRELEKRLSKFQILENRKILLSVGHLVTRKGFHWFVENVVPELLQERNDFVYLIAGDGVYRERIKENIKTRHLEDYVVMMGEVSDETLKLLYNSADIFIMPNMPVEGDIEGFGIVALEASSCGAAVIASKLEGIRDAVQHEGNGFLIEPYDVQGFTNAITELLENEKGRQELRKQVRQFTLENYSWASIVRKYFEELSTVLPKVIR